VAAPVSTHNHAKIVAPVFIKLSTLDVSAVTDLKTPIILALAATTTTPSAADVKPFVTFKVVDVIPHFRVIAPPKTFSSNGSVHQSKAATPTPSKSSFLK